MLPFFASMRASASRSRRLSAATNTLSFAFGIPPASGPAFPPNSLAACPAPFGLPFRADPVSVARLLRELALMVRHSLELFGFHQPQTASRPIWHVRCHPRCNSTAAFLRSFSSALGDISYAVFSLHKISHTV